jgi:hypothetical protein
MNWQDEPAGPLFTRLDSDRRSIVERAVKYASFTLQKICLPENWDKDNDELVHDYQSIGAQGVNHLSNRIMLAAFAPSRPFFRVDVPTETLRKLNASKQEIDAVTEQLAQLERDAVRVMDTLAVRPKLFEILKHLIVVGDVLAEYSKDTIMVYGMRQYVVRRNKYGKVRLIVLKECMAYGDYTDEARKVLEEAGRLGEDHEETDYYTKVCWDHKTKKHRVTYWCDDIQLPGDESHDDNALPYKVMTWDLAAGDHYGTGLVEEYAGAFAALSMLSEAQVQAAVLASEFRYLVNPNGMTSVDDLNDSINGQALPGADGDIALLEAAHAGQKIQAIQALSSDYVNVLGRAFLLSSAVIRDSERTTATEIRANITELETGLGGAYSRISVDLQIPTARWLLKQIDMPAKALNAADLSVVTGLDALSRNGDAEALQAWLGDLALLNNLPEDVKAVLDMSSVATAFGINRGVETKKYVKDAGQVQQEQQQKQAQEVAAQQAIDSNAAQAAQPQGPM